MLKTPWRPSVDVNPLFRPLRPKPSELMMRLAWEKEEGCCIGETEFKKGGHVREWQKKTKQWVSGEMSPLQTVYKTVFYFDEPLWRNLCWPGDWLSPPQTDWRQQPQSSLRRGLLQTAPEGGRWTWFRSENAGISFGWRQSRIDTLMERMSEAARAQRWHVVSLSETCSPGLFVLSKMNIYFCHVCRCYHLTNIWWHTRHLCLLSFVKMFDDRREGEGSKRKESECNRKLFKGLA